MKIIEDYRSEIALRLKKSPSDIFLFWKGRVALYTLLKAMGIKKDDEVIIPGFTCVVVPNAIKYLGGIPVYVDIDENTMNADFNKILNAVTNRTKVIIIQNTFGLSSDVDRISEFAKEHGLYTIEDCTHGFGGTFKMKPNGSYCDAAFYSTQWNKPYSTGIGGFSVLNDGRLKDKMKELENSLISPSFFDEISLLSLNLMNKILLNPFTYWTVRDMYRLLTRYGLVTGSSEQKEITSVIMPKKYFKGISTIQAWLGTKRISDINTKIKKRKENALKYTLFLKENGKEHVKEKYFSDHSFLKYPLLVTDRDSFKIKAAKSHIPLGDWFVSPIHPVLDNFEIWDIDPASIPLAMKISMQIVNLPTEGADATKVIRFLESEIDLIR